MQAQPSGVPPPPPGYAPPYYAPAPPVAQASMSTMNIVGFVFVVLAIIAALVASGLSWDEAYGWAAGIYLLSAVLFLISGVFFAMARRARMPVASPYGPR